MYKTLKIKSGVKDYSVAFIDKIREGFDALGGKDLYVIMDKNVALCYRRELAVFLKKYPHIIIEATEVHKTLDYVNSVIHQIIEENTRRGCVLAAIGGGIIQDITGFIASILYRGVDWFFYPTTLLAQSDSCIGSKTSINIGPYKNQVGNFYPPRRIFLDVNFLRTLSAEDIKSGLGEIIKVHLLDSEKSMRYVEMNYAKALAGQGVMYDLIIKSLKIKKGIIETDEFDRGYRNIMNYGHSFGHALESLTRYKLNHGQAVTIGMDISNYLSYNLGLLSKEKYTEMKRVLLLNWPDYNFKKLKLQSFFAALARDKKNTGLGVTLILTKGPGKMIKRSLAFEAGIKKIISAYFADNL